MTGKARRLDLGVAENTVGERRRFAIMAGMGFDADALTLVAARPRLKRRLGKLVYPVAGSQVYLQRGLPRLGLQSRSGYHLGQVRGRVQHPNLLRQPQPSTRRVVQRWALGPLRSRRGRD